MSILSDINAKKTHCPKGHPYEGENLRLNPKRKGRWCKICAVESTKRQRIARQEKYGKGKHRKTTDYEREFVLKCDDGCWLWYGKDRLAIWDKKLEKNIQVRRFLYEKHIGSIEPELKLIMTCDRIRCVSPYHMKKMTNSEATAISNVKKNRIPKPFCSKGHPFNEENTIRKKNGKRVCRICKNAANKKTRERVK